jgi:hypothetical protein
MKLEFNSIEELKDFATNVLGLVQAAAPISAPTVPAAPVAPAPTVPAAPAAPAAPVAAPTAAKTYTRDDIVNASIPLLDTHLADLQALMNKYGIATIQDLQENSFAAFAADLRALGGAI